MCHAEDHGIFRRDICLSQRKIKLSTEGLCTREVQGEVDFRNQCDCGPRGGRSELVSFVHGEQTDHDRNWLWFMVGGIQ